MLSRISPETKPAHSNVRSLMPVPCRPSNVDRTCRESGGDDYLQRQFESGTGRYLWTRHAKLLDRQPCSCGNFHIRKSLQAFLRLFGSILLSRVMLPDPVRSTNNEPAPDPSHGPYERAFSLARIFHAPCVLFKCTLYA